MQPVLAVSETNMRVGRLTLRAIDQRTAGAPSRGLGNVGRLDVIRTKNVEDALPRDDQVIRDDPPVAPPPHCLRAHDRAPPFLSQGAQPGEAGLEGLAQRVIGIIVKALILPESFYGRRKLLDFRLHDA